MHTLLLLPPTSPMAPTKRNFFPHHPPSYTAKPCPDLCASACNPTQNFFRFCPPLCVPLCPSFCQPFPDFLRSPQPPPSVHTTGTDYHHPHHNYLSPLFITMIILLASSFVIAISYLIYFSLFSSSRSSVRRQHNTRRAVEFDQSMDVSNFHPVWYITTVGLQRSAIDSISVCSYKKGDGLVQEVTCPICLAEFQERDALRLLPKCCHAFHVPCIDTWLSSHTNCPVCRASVLQANANPEPREGRVVEIAQDPSSSGGVSRENDGEFEGGREVEGEEGEAWRPMRRAASMDSLCVELGEKVNTCSSGVNSLGERSLSCTGKLFSSSRNGFW